MTSTFFPTSNNMSNKSKTQLSEAAEKTGLKMNVKTTEAMMLNNK